MEKIFFKLIFILALVSAGILTSCEDEGTVEKTTLTITSIEPLTAHIGDTITINGTGFSPDRTQNTVKFVDESGLVGGGETGLVASATETQLKVVIPDYVCTGVVFVSYWEQSVTSSQEFILDESLPNPPVITAITPANGYVGSEVTITGDNFGTNASLVKVLFGETEADTLLSVTMTEITTNVPEGLSAGEISVSVKRLDAVSDPMTFVVNNAAANVTTAYWTTPGQIYRGEITEAGVDIQVIYTWSEDVPINQPRGIALDATNGMLYWCEHGGPSIMKAPADGSGPVETVFDYENDGVKQANDIAFNSAENSVYFTEEWGNEQYIRKGDLTSGTITNIYTISEASYVGPYALKLSLASNKIYWTELSGKVYEGSLDGEVTASPKLLFDSSDGLSQPMGLAIDNTNNTIYILDNLEDFDNGGFVSALYKGNLDGSGSLTKIMGTGDDLLNNPTDLEIDLENGYIFWLNYGDGVGVIKRAALDGSAVETLFTGVYGTFSICIFIDICYNIINELIAAKQFGLEL